MTLAGAATERSPCRDSDSAPSSSTSLPSSASPPSSHDSIRIADGGIAARTPATSASEQLRGVRGHLARLNAPRIVTIHQPRVADPFSVAGRIGRSAAPIAASGNIGR